MPDNAAARFTLSLDFLTAHELRSPDFVRMAARHGFECISLNIQPAPPNFTANMDFNIPTQDLLGDTADRREVKRLMEGEGIRLTLMEGILLLPGFAIDSIEQALETTAYLGGDQAVVAVMDDDWNRAVDAIAAIGAACKPFGVRPLIEFMMFSACKTLQDGARMVAESGSDNLALMVDTLHFVRTGAQPADLSTVDPALIGRVQLCDGPLKAPENLFEEAVMNRMTPGEGELPLRDIFSWIRAGTIVGLEVPQEALAKQGVGTEERVARIAQAARRLLAELEPA